MWKSELKIEDKRATLVEMDKVLGLRLDEAKEEEIPQEITDLAQKRMEAKKNKEWAEADRLREMIKESGFLVEDMAEGFKIKMLDKGNN